VLKRLLASLAIVSLLIAGALLVYWWRSYHGHSDTFTLGKVGSTKSVFTSQPGGRLTVEVIDYQSALVTSHLEFHSFREIIGYFLLIPGLWLAIKIRNWLPRPPGREVRNPKPETRTPAAGKKSK
jgi:hypothetical protein